MAHQFKTVGWQDFGRDPDKARHWGDPASEGVNLDEVKGVFVSVTNPDDAEDRHMFWVYVYTPYKSWAEWYVWIETLMAGHGMEL